MSTRPHFAKNTAYYTFSIRDIPPNFHYWHPVYICALIPIHSASIWIPIRHGTISWKWRIFLLENGFTLLFAVKRIPWRSMWTVTFLERHHLTDLLPIRTIRTFAALVHAVLHYRKPFHLWERVGSMYLEPPKETSVGWSILVMRCVMRKSRNCWMKAHLQLWIRRYLMINHPIWQIHGGLGHIRYTSYNG